MAFRFQNVCNAVPTLDITGYVYIDPHAGSTQGEPNTIVVKEDTDTDLVQREEVNSLGIKCLFLQKNNFIRFAVYI